MGYRQKIQLSGNTENELKYKKVTKIVRNNSQLTLWMIVQELSTDNLYG
jgi:hypothetical protein